MAHGNLNMISNYKIDLITSEQTLDLRQKVLKPFLSKKECLNPEDLSPITTHFGLFYNEHLISVATIFPASNTNMHCGFPYRLRGMATDIKYQGQGFGGALLMSTIDFLKDKRCDLLWCNARFKAFPFYKSNGFQFSGDMFDLPDIGPHKVMYKRIIGK